MNGYAPTIGGEIYFETEGEGKPLLFSHAAIADHTMWDPQIAHFSKTHRVIAYDHRGFGKSRSEPGTYALTDDIEAVYGELGLDKATLVGCSRGARAILDFAVAHPDRVSGLVWVCGDVSGLRLPPREGDADLFTRLEEAWQAADWNTVADLETNVWLDGILEEPGRVPGALRETVRSWIHQVRTAVDPGIALDESALAAADHLTNLHAPTLVVVGLLDTHATVESAKYLAENLPDAEVVTFEDSAHLPSVEHGARFNAAVDRFLRRHNL